MTTKAHGYCAAARRIAISVSSFSGSLSAPVPALGWLTAESAGTIIVGMELGIIALEGKDAVVVVPVAGVVVDGAAMGVSEVEEEVVEATISQVCEGVYPSSELDVVDVAESDAESVGDEVYVVT